MWQLGALVSERLRACNILDEPVRGTSLRGANLCLEESFCSWILEGLGGLHRDGLGSHPSALN